MTAPKPPPHKKRGPKPGNPYGHPTRCWCSQPCKDFANALAAQRRRDYAARTGKVLRHGYFVDPKQGVSS